MTYYQERSLIIISGGRNDKLDGMVLGDIWVLRLQVLEYCQVKIQSDLKMEPRYSHQAVLFGSKLFIFGGMNSKMTLDMTAQEFELDCAIVQNRFNIQERQKEEARI